MTPEYHSSNPLFNPSRLFKHLFFTGMILCALFLSVLIILPTHPTQAMSEEEPTATITITPATTQLTEMAMTDTPTSTPTPTPTDSVTPSETYTLTPTLTSTIASTSTSTYTPTPSITTTPTPQPFYIPIIFYQIVPTSTPTPTLTPTPVSTPSTVLYCTAPHIAIPDNDANGVSSIFTIPDPRIILDLDLRLDIDHTWVGDLIVKLDHQETGKSAVLLDRPGYPSTTWGCVENNIVSILDDELTMPVENQCYSNPNNIPAISGIYVPNNPLELFDVDSTAGHWQLTVSDNSENDTGTLNEWCLAVTVNDYYIAPTPTPVIGHLPDQAIVYGVTGKKQSLPLDCESRSAVDWAKFFGKSIPELDFFYNLPSSNDPDAGFVGNVYGSWGQIPPNPYGVHAIPVANLLNNYGLSAYPRKLLNWDLLRSEIAAGRPVITWIIGDYTYPNYHLLENSIPIYYTSTSGHMTIVASYEHTVVVTGYTPTNVSYLDGDTIFTISLSQFLSSWSALGNMAITNQP